MGVPLADALTGHNSGKKTVFVKGQRAMEHGIEEGISLFNSGWFFEAHEALEAVWLKSKGRRRNFLHGLIQVAAAFHHYTHGNAPGFRSLLEKGCAKLEKAGAEAEGVDLAGFMLELQPWREHSVRSSSSADSAPPLPRLAITGDYQDKP
ncbi:MAG: DUF309 domain-containing protein [Acidobacteriota bacterium]